MLHHFVPQTADKYAIIRKRYESFQKTKKKDKIFLNDLI